MDSNSEAASTPTPYLRIELETEDELLAFRTLLRKGMNTWDTAPKWMFELSTIVEDKARGL
jgi:hypothetical protein